jgi:ADP-ribose pyrophosphatase YjhB (NUDIX family)
MSDFRVRVEPWLRPFFQAFSRLSRGATLGVRGLALDDQNRILLVRHTYISGWHLPGGGVERDQTVEAALIRELAEEGGVDVIGRPRLISIHDHRETFRGDHVLFYRVEAWRPCQATAHMEIAETGWFPADDLPVDTTRATRARIREALGEVESDPMW